MVERKKKCEKEKTITNSFDWLTTTMRKKKHTEKNAKSLSGIQRERNQKRKNGKTKKAFNIFFI